MCELPLLFLTTMVLLFYTLYNKCTFIINLKCHYVTVTPVVAAYNLTSTPKVNDSVELRCEKIRANPDIDSVTWKKNGSPLDTSGGRYSGGDKTTPTLTIKSAIRSDKGHFVCTMTNQLGTGESAPIHLDVHGM